MKVLLLQHVKKLGHKGDIIEVADGFAVNSLFPQKKAVQATAKIVNDHKMKQKAQGEKEAQLKDQQIKSIQALTGKRVVIEEKLNAKGSLYHALGPKEIIRAVHDQYRLNIPNTFFSEKYAIKEAGEHEIKISAHEVSGNFTLEVSGK
jgi:large subunit ribosomal protein L9